MTAGLDAPRTDLLPPGLEVTDSRRRLYEVALELFAERGYHAVSIRDLAEALGQQPSAIYFHVDSKATLLFELACIGHRTHYESLRDALLDAGREPRDQLAAVVQTHVRVHLEYPSMARLTNRELRALDGAQFDEAVAIRAQSEQIFIDVIERGVRLGAFSVADPWLAAKGVAAMAMRLPEWWTPAAPRTHEQIIENYVEFALRLVE